MEWKLNISNCSKKKVTIILEIQYHISVQTDVSDCIHIVSKHIEFDIEKPCWPVGQSDLSKHRDEMTKKEDFEWKAVDETFES